MTVKVKKVSSDTVDAIERPRHLPISTGDSHPWESEPRRRKRRWTQVTAPQALLISDLVCLSLPAVWEPRHVPGIETTALLSCVLFWSADLYRPRLQALVLDEVPALLGRLLAAAGVVATVSALRHPSLSVSIYLEAAAAAVVLTLTGRAIVDFAIRKARRIGLVQHKSIIIGTGPIADRLSETLAAVPEYGLSVVGYLADHSAPGSVVDTSPYLGPIESLRSRIDETGAGVVLVSDQGFAEHELTVIVRQALWNDCTIFMVPRLYEVSGLGWTSEMIGSIPVERRLGRNGRRGVPWKCKRIFDIVVSSVALLALSPLLGVCALAVRIDGGPGILFRQTRIGRDGHPFEILKFRTLQPADDTESGTKWSIQNDGRLTRVGRFLRRTSLDELPQLWTILRGDMTIVGPRPERPHFVEKSRLRCQRTSLDIVFPPA